MSYLALNPSLLNENDGEGSVGGGGNYNNNNNKKQQLRNTNTNNKTIKKKYNQNQNNQKVSSMMQNIGYSAGGHNYDPMEDSNNDEPGDFNPPNYAELTKLPNGGSDSNIPNSLSSLVQPNSNNANAMMANMPSNAMNTPTNVPVMKESFKGLSYANIPSNNEYEGNTAYVRPFVPYYNNNQMSNDTTPLERKNKDPLMEKLNYMILLLEEQQNERTDHIMEELILYFFLGIFMIFMVDSFARSGRYVR